MGYLTVTRREGEMIRLTIDPGVDAEKLLKELLRDGITMHIGAIQGQSQVRRYRGPEADAHPPGRADQCLTERVSLLSVRPWSSVDR